MEDYGLDLHASMLLQEYRERYPEFLKLREVAMQKLSEIVNNSDIELNSMESRIKSEKSLVGKLQRKGHKYNTITDITDIFGARIIAFYNEDVDRIAAITETLFEVDWDNSVDKRRMHQFDSFGYNSLHYICRIPKSLYYDPEYPELNQIPFEFQMRTALQHVWSAIQHDIGYKSEIESPMEYHRNLSRLAGMLELADNEFSRIRNSINEYRRRVQSLLKKGKLEEVPLDGDTFQSYLSRHPFMELNSRIAAINQAELHPASYRPYLSVLRQMGMKTLADVERLIRDQHDNAYKLALFQIGSTDIDILAETIGIQNICIVQILKTGGGLAGLHNMFETIDGPSPNNEIMAKITMEQARRLPFLKEKG